MPQLCAITGSILDLGLQPSPGLKVVVRSAKQSIARVGDDLVLPGTREIDVPANGQISLSLVSGAYILDAYAQNGDSVANVRFTVPDAPTANLEQLINLPAPPSLNAAEQAVLDAQTARDLANTSAAAASTSATAAGTARTAAETARDNASASATAASASASASEAARVLADQRAAAALTSQQAASGSASAAQASAADAVAAENAAESAATAAAGSASDAAASASTAQTARDAALSARGDAIAARNDAQAASLSATASSGAASTSATAAATSASQAATSAQAASASATQAAGSATTAASIAASVNASQAAAATSATNAATSAAAASASEAAAATSATGAAASAATASTQATAAQAARTAAEAAEAAAETAQIAAEAARGAVENARDDAVAAKAAAEAARDDAQDSADSAIGADTSAAAHAAAALASANAADVDRIAAQAAKTSAEAARDTAVSSAASASSSAALADADRIAAETARVGIETIRDQAAVSATQANTSAGNAAGSAAQALAIYGSAAAEQQAIINAQNAASRAEAAALSASTAQQQDLSGITAQALHRSPNAVTAMFIYDTSKDSDGGAWTEKCQHTSWWNETIFGKWLGAQDSELNARYANPTSGPELISNGNFSSGTSGWTTTSANVSVAGGVANIAPLANLTRQGLSQAFTTVVGATYRLTYRVASGGGGNTHVFVGTSYASNANGSGSTAVGSRTLIFTATATTTVLTVGVWGINETLGIADVSIRLVTALTTAPNDYFQLTTDGRFYRLNKNLLASTATLATQTQFLSAGTYTLSSTTGSSGSVAVSGAATASHTAGGAATTFTVATSGNVTFTVTGSVLTAQCEAGFVATTYEANGASRITEVFRGNKRDFPRLAAIVGEANFVTIYDLTEPGRPMWMRFIGATLASNSQALYVQGGYSVNGIAALSGQIVVSANTISGITILDFPSDRSTVRYQFAPLSVFRGGLAQRNATMGFDTVLSTGAAPPSPVNAIAMAVLPDAPVDPVTGLRVPTIAVATGGGVSVIKHNGTVVNSSINTTFDQIILRPELLSASRFDRGWWYYAANPGGLGASFTLLNRTPDQAPGFGIGNTIKLVDAGRSRLLRRSSTAARAQMARAHESDPARSLIATVGDTFNTGWMTGDIRRCYLSDTEVGALTGPELLTNGGFSNGLTGWVPLDANTSVDASSGAAVFSSPSGLRSLLVQTIPSVPGKAYRITFDKVSGALLNNPAMTVRVWENNWGSAQIFNREYGLSAAGTYEFFVTATTNAIVVGFDLAAGNSGVSFTVDNVSVREAVADRSYRARAAVLNGTLTRAQLASSTSLVGFSGFSAANYLREPYSADLDFGTGEWTASAWVNIPTTLPAEGVERITNGGFDTDVSGWAPIAGSTIEWVDGRIRVVTSNINQGAQQFVTTEVGKVYSLKGNLVSGSSPRIWIGGAAFSPSASFDIRFAATSTSTEIRLSNSEAVRTLEWDNISVKEVLPSAIFDRAHSTGPRIRLAMNGLGNLTAEASDGTTTRTVTTTAAYNTAQWLKARVNYTTDGTLAILVNGREVAATRGAPLLTLNNASAVLTIGNSFALDAPFPGSIALLKLGATVPTPEQATFMFEQEKQLFRAGALSVLPDSGAIVDMAYDDATDRWVAISAANESCWTGLVRNSVTPVPAGSYTRVVATSGVELAARSTTNPGVDVTIPAYGLREELVKRAEAASRLSRELAVYDFVGGFTANTTNGSTAITNVANLTYPTSYVGARVSGTGIPANTTIVGVSGTTIYLSAAATATATGVSISFLDFILPVGLEARTVFSGGSQQREGTTAAWVRLFDGFKEAVRFNAAPGATAQIQIQATRGAVQ